MLLELGHHHDVLGKVIITVVLQVEHGFANLTISNISVVFSNRIGVFELIVVACTLVELDILERWRLVAILLDTCRLFQDGGRRFGGFFLDLLRGRFRSDGSGRLLGCRTSSNSSGVDFQSRHRWVTHHRLGEEVVRSRFGWLLD